MPVNYECDCCVDCCCDCDCTYNCNYHCEQCENSITGSAVDIDLCEGDSEVRADVTVRKNKNCCVRVWGQIKDCEGNPVGEAQVKLLRSHYYHGKLEFEGIAHTTSDCMGFYQFDVCVENNHTKYRILVGKACIGKERIIYGKDVCNPCNK